MNGALPPSHLPSLPELSPLCRNLLRKLGWKRAVVLGDNPAWDPAELESEGVEVVRVEDGGEIPSDLKETILLLPGHFEFLKDPKGVLSSFAKALENTPLGIICSSDRQLSSTSIPAADPAAHRWTFSELWDDLTEAGVTPYWGTHTQSGDAWFERHHSLIVATRDKALGEKVNGWLETGIASFSLSEGIGSEEPSPHRPVRVCICTDEIFGPSSNGGIGTAYTAMAEFLAKAGQEVTVLFQGEVTSAEPMFHWIEFYKEKGIELVHHSMRKLRGLSWEDEYLRRSYADYQWLKEREAEGSFDVVHFPECNGKAFYTCLAKHQGLAFQETAICIGTHGNTKWVYEGHGAPFFSKFQLNTYFMEMQSSKWCDVLVSPSYFLVHWMKHHGWTMPPKYYAQQNIQPYTARGEDLKREEPFPDVEKITELVFFGRIEARKGIVILCDALDIVGPMLVERGIEMTFMGKEVPLLDTMSRPYLEKRSEKWKFKWKIINDFNQDKAVAYLQGEGRVAVMPSLADNSPYTVLECIGLGVPFVSSRVGGIAELIDPRDVDQATYAHRDRKLLHHQLAKRLESALEDGIRPCRRAVSAVDNDEVWINWHKSLVDHPAYRVEEDVQPIPKIHSLLLSDPDNLASNSFPDRLELLQAQTVAPASIAVLVDQGADDRVIGRKEGSTEAVGLRGVSHVIPAEGVGDYLGLRDWLSGLDDDYVLVSESAANHKPEQFETLGKVAARSGADLYSSFREEYAFDPEVPGENEKMPDIFFPVGAVPLLPIYAYAYGGGMLMLRASTFLEVLPSSGEEYTPFDLPALIARAVVLEKEYEVVPERLHTYVHLGNPLGVKPYSVCGHNPHSYVRDVFDASLPSHLAMLCNFDEEEDGAAAPPNENLVQKYWENLYIMQEELPQMQDGLAQSKQELADQSDWLAKREEFIEELNTKLAETDAALSKQKKLAEKRKQELREAALKQKLVEKDNEHLKYRLNRKLGVRLKKSLGKRVKGKDRETEG